MLTYKQTRTRMKSHKPNRYKENQQLQNTTKIQLRNDTTTNSNPVKKCDLHIKTPIPQRTPMYYLSWRVPRGGILIPSNIFNKPYQKANIAGAMSKKTMFPIKQIQWPYYIKIECAGLLAPDMNLNNLHPTT